MVHPNPILRALAAAEDMRDSFPPETLISGSAILNKALDAVCHHHGGQTISFFPLALNIPDADPPQDVHTIHAGWFEQKGEPDAFIALLFNTKSHAFDIVASPEPAWEKAKWLSTMLHLAVVEDRATRSPNSRTPSGQTLH